MKNLFKLTVVVLSIFAFAQAEALVCPAGQYVYNTPSGSVCVYNGTAGSAAPVAPSKVKPLNCPAGQYAYYDGPGSQGVCVYNGMA